MSRTAVSTEYIHSDNSLGAATAKKYFVRRSSRIVRVPEIFFEYKYSSFSTVLESIDIPKTYNQAAANPLWKEAMDLEIRALEENQTWELVLKPENTSITGSKWYIQLNLTLIAL